MFVSQKLRGWLNRLRGPLAAAALLALFLLSVWLRHLAFSSEFVLFSYLQVVAALLCVTYAANALIRFRGTHDRFTLILAFGFFLAGVIETVTIYGFYGELSSAAQQAHVPLSWMVGRTLLAALLLAALVVERRVPHFRELGREVAVALVVVCAVAYLTGVAYLGVPADPAIYPSAWIARPWDLLPGALFLVAAVGFGRRLRAGSSVFDRALCAALWLNVGCHVVATESARLFDAPFTLAQVLKVSSYGLVLGGALLDNAQLFEQVRRLAISDSLTGLGNYRTFVSVIESEIQRSQRSGRPFSLLLMDLDGLKQINDRYGHLVGSRAICRLGNVLRQHCRAMDTAARYGGDEFALVLPEAGADAARLVGQRICARLASDGLQPAVTVSVGAAVFPHDGRTIEELLNAADRALYGMKRHGTGVLSLARIAAACL